MIVVVSDLHLTDGASGTTAEPGAFGLFARLLGEMARHAGHRAGGFRPLDEGIDLVLLGDILDLLRSSGWPARADASARVARPWEAPEEIAPTVARIVERTLQRNAEGLSVLASLARDGALFYEEGQPYRVPVRISYFVGNHDWLLRLPGSAYDEIRERVVTSIGLVQDPGRPFPHALDEAAPELAARAALHRLVLRHGDVHDGFNFAGGRNHSAIGDAVVIEILNRFPECVREELGLAADAPVYLALREIDNVRPFTLIPAWVLGVIRRFGLEGAMGGAAILAVWNRLAEEFFDLQRIRRADRSWRWDEVDRLELGFRFLKGLTAGRIARATSNQLLRLVADRHRRFAQHALREPEIVSGAARFVAYGHTHAHEIRPLDARAGEGIGKQFYLNSGTWRPTYRQTVAGPERLEFLGFHALTVLAFYAGDERAGRGFEVWNGALEGPL
ncbi:MAG: hypothetical protein H0V09_03775 [Gemmatimonadetes bacterium]|nr:hypothetical protein [Gemmatimonadota bacterium]